MGASICMQLAHVRTHTQVRSHVRMHTQVRSCRALHLHHPRDARFCYLVAPTKCLQVPKGRGCGWHQQYSHAESSGTSSGPCLTPQASLRHGTVG